MILRTATPGDINALKELYYGTIISINLKDYNPEQINPGLQLRSVQRAC